MVSSILPLALEEVELRRRGRVILGPVTWTLQGEGLTVLMGPNGSGKTSLLRTMHGLERVTRGRVGWTGDAVQARARQAFVFQTPILMRRSILDCIAFPLRLDRQPLRTARAAAAEAAERVGLTVPLDRPAEVLSGGERQKMALARALIRRPEVLFLDEPSANLDVRATRDIESILLDARLAGTRIVMATHDIGQARRLADEVLFLSDGKLLDAAPRDAFFGGTISRQAQAHLNGELLP